MDRHSDIDPGVNILPKSDSLEKGELYFPKLFPVKTPILQFIENNFPFHFKLFTRVQNNIQIKICNLILFDRTQKTLLSEHVLLLNLA